MDEDDNDVLEELRTKKDDDIKSILSKKKLDSFELDDFMSNY